jgi:hypothetical protein
MTRRETIGVRVRAVAGAIWTTNHRSEMRGIVTGETRGRRGMGTVIGEGMTGKGAMRGIEETIEIGIGIAREGIEIEGMIEETERGAMTGTAIEIGEIGERITTREIGAITVTETARETDLSTMMVVARGEIGARDEKGTMRGIGMEREETPDRKMGLEGIEKGTTATEGTTEIAIAIRVWTRESIDAMTTMRGRARVTGTCHRRGDATRGSDRRPHAGTRRRRQRTSRTTGALFGQFFF